MAFSPFNLHAPDFSTLQPPIQPFAANLAIYLGIANALGVVTHPAARPTRPQDIPLPSEQSLFSFSIRLPREDPFEFVGSEITGFNKRHVRKLKQIARQSAKRARASRTADEKMGFMRIAADAHWFSSQYFLKGQYLDNALDQLCHGAELMNMQGISGAEAVFWESAADTADEMKMTREMRNCACLAVDAWGEFEGKTSGRPEKLSDILARQRNLIYDLNLTGSALLTAQKFDEMSDHLTKILKRFTPLERVMALIHMAVYQPAVFFFAIDEEVKDFKSDIFSIMGNMLKSASQLYGSAQVPDPTALEPDEQQIISCMHCLISFADEFQKSGQTAFSWQVRPI